MKSLGHPADAYASAISRMKDTNRTEIPCSRRPLATSFAHSSSPPCWIQQIVSGFGDIFSSDLRRNNNFIRRCRDPRQRILRRRVAPRREIEARHAGEPLVARLESLLQATLGLNAQRHLIDPPLVEAKLA